MEESQREGSSSKTAAHKINSKPTRQKRVERVLRTLQVSRIRECDVEELI